MARVDLRVPDAELVEWKAKAGKRGLSAWIRERCNGGAEVTTFSLPATEDKWLAPFHKHTAESNWRTCLCSTCVKKRKDHNL